MVTAGECPYCQAEFEIPAPGERCACRHCGRELQAAAQRAFADGHRSFLAGQEALAALPERRSKPRYDRAEAEALQHLQRAHSALLEAFRFRLPESQREHAVEMMAEISRVFAGREVISPLEASYWARVTIEQNCLREVDALQARLDGPRRPGLLAPLVRLHWRLRRRQLVSALAKLDAQLRVLEQAIAFADPPHARRPTR